MQIIKIDNNPESFLELIKTLKNEHPNLAFISHIGGEIGFRVILYNSLVYQFASKQRELNNFIVGLCFIGNTFYLKHYCDIIIEVQDIAFTYKKEELLDEIKESEYFPLRFPSNKPYIGSNANHLFYKVGYINWQYEEILLELQLANIFYTYYHTSSSSITGHPYRIQVSYNMVDLYIGKINNLLFQIMSRNDFFNKYHAVKNIDENVLFISETSFKNFIKNTDKNDNIVVWVRNTSHAPLRNLPESCYTALFEYCIQNKKHLYIFLDLIKVDVPENEYLHVCDFRINNQPLFDEFVKICNKAYLYIGCDSGSSYIASYYTKANCLLYNGQWEYSLTTNPQPIFNTKEELIAMLDSKYLTSNKLLE
jgi:hypothetical protein